MEVDSQNNKDSVAGPDPARDPIIFCRSMQDFECRHRRNTSGTIRSAFDNLIKIKATAVRQPLGLSPGAGAKVLGSLPPTPPQSG